MATYLFLWNPKKWDWKNLQKQVKEVIVGKKVQEPWSTGNRTKELNDGDRFLMMKLGEEPKGIIACGTISNFRYRPHWDNQKANLGKELPNVDLNFEILSAQPLIEQDELAKRFTNEVSSWTPNASGIVIPDNVADNIFKILKARQPLETTKITQPVLFARIGYMQNYCGPIDGDLPIGGGEFNKTDTGYEACNFLEVDGKIHGYYQPSMKSQRINLERIDPSKNVSDRLDGVLVIFFATLPKSAVTNTNDDILSSSAVIVGWYKNATVYREKQHIDRIIENKPQDIYYLEVDDKDAYLLPVENRAFKMGHGIKGQKEGNPGQSNSFYIYDKNKKLKDMSLFQNKWIGEAINYVNSYRGNYLKTELDRIEQNVINSQYGKSKQSGAGFQSNIEVRLAVESFAMLKAEQELIKRGYEVQIKNDKGQDICSNSSFDMKAYKDNQEYLVEVKGTQSDGTSVIFTHNEVELYKAQESKVILCIVHSVRLLNEKAVKNSGEVIIHDPWIINESKLKTISYFYKF